MHILLVVDKFENFDEKVSVLTRQFPNAEFKVFLNSSCENLKTDKFVSKNFVSMYSSGLSKQLSIAAIACKDSVLIYYTSAFLDDEVIRDMKQKIIDGNKIVYVKQKKNAFEKFFERVYNLILRLIFGANDRLASIKIQYIDAEVIEEVLSKIGFGFRILDAFEQKSCDLLYDKLPAKTLTIKKTIKKSNYINLAFLILFISLTVVLGVLFSMQFWLWVLLITLSLCLMFFQIMLAVKNIFDERLKN